MGRRVGEPGQKLAAEFLKSYYESENIDSPFGGSNYYQTIPSSFFNDKYGSSEKKFNSANEVYEDNIHSGIIDNNIKNTITNSKITII